MRKPISTQTHGVLDYLTVAMFATLPKLLGFNKPVTCAMQSLAVAKLAYALCTDHELGVVRKIPMKAHLVLDSIGGAGLAALPFLLDDDDDTAKAVCLTLGATDIVVGALTQTQPSSQTSLPRQAFRSATRSIGRGAQRVREFAGTQRE